MQATETEKKQFRNEMSKMTCEELRSRFRFIQDETQNLLDASTDSGIVGKEFVIEPVKEHLWKQEMLQAAIDERERAQKVQCSLEPKPIALKIEVSDPYENEDYFPELQITDAPEKEPVSKWLDNYVAFSRKWSPRSFDGFHEACALWLLSTVAARRVVLNFGKPYYTPLYIALTARTSLYAKSTAGDIASQVIRASGLDWLLAPDDSTPQAFIRGLSRQVPSNFDDLDSAEQTRVTNSLALAGQRGWQYDEFGQHVAAIMRPGGYMEEFRGLLRKFDDCRESYTTSRITRENIKVENPYLALLAIMTPADIVPFAKRGAAMWNDGFWARFAFVCPDKEESKRERFPVGERIVPKSIVDPLMAWHNKLGMPNIDIEDVTDEDDKKTGRKHVVVGEYKPKTCIMDQRIPDVFYAYHDGLNDLLKKSSRTDLDGNYARFAEKAMRIAILLASFENDNYIELTHWEKAQSITERWRKNLSSLFSQVVTTAESDEKRSSEDKFVACLRKHDNLTLREIRQRTGLSADEAIQIEVNLLKLGIITSSKTLHSVRYSVKSTFKIEETIHN